ncbi:MAG TPA: ferritin family protein [bacterium]|nr:ferritin family protein [bacterium]
MRPSPIEEIISFAREKERESILFYDDLAKKIENPVLKETILAMADQERKHEKLLKNLTPTNLQTLVSPDSPDMKISDYLVEVEPSRDMSYQEILIVAMKREEKSYALYSDLESRAADTATRKLFGLLKGEELKHKATLEREYEGRVLSEG